MQNPPASSASAQQPLISFIVTYYNLPPQLLGASIDSILALSLAPEEREIIVIDDGSEESPLETLREKWNDILYIRQQNQGLSAARNLGIEACRGTFIQFVDGDDLLNTSNEYYPKNAYLESAGMAVNPVDGKVYGLFYLTDVPLPEEIVNDPDFFGDSIDSGYAICTIDLESMQVTPITQGLYYENFVTFAINSEGRAFALTSGATAGYEGEDGKMYDINGNLTGAQLYEFDLASGLVVATKGATGYCSQAKRQSACFSMKDPSKMYWNGFYNSGMGYNAYGNWGPLPDSDWKNNGKYDTALYEVDINTGETTRIAKITNRFSFSCMWVVEDDSPVVAGDVNGDGLVTSIDITVLYNYLLLGDDTTTCSWAMTPTW